MSTKFPSVVQALSTVFWGDVGVAQAISCLYSGLTPAEFRRLRVLCKEKHVDPNNLYIWIGQLSKQEGDPDPIGRWMIPQVFDGREVLRAVKEHGKDSVDLWHSGMGEQSVCLLVDCPMESDDVSIERQAAQLDRLQEAVGMPLSVVIMSGDARPESVRRAGVAPANLDRGKSLHGHFALHPALNPKIPEHKALWRNIQDHLIVFLRSDPAIHDVPRLMRAPSVLGYKAFKNSGLCRIQTTLIAEHHGVDPWKLLDALRKALADDGVSDVPLALQAIKTAKNWMADAKIFHENGEISKEARDEINRLAARAWNARCINQDEARTVTSLLPRKERPGRGMPRFYDDNPIGAADAEIIRATEILYMEPDHILQLRGGQTIRFDQVKDKVRCCCPEHGYRSRTKLSAFAWRRDEAVFCCCPSCRLTWKLEPAGLPKICKSDLTPWVMENGNG